MPSWIVWVICIVCPRIDLIGIRMALEVEDLNYPLPDGLTVKGTFAMNPSLQLLYYKYTV